MSTELDNMVQALGLELADLESRMVETLQLHTATTLERLAGEIAALPEPEPGQPGADGRDGLDRVLALPRYVREGESCAPNEIAWHKGGIWQSVRVTSGNPDDDPPGWKCLVPGLIAFETRQDWQRREVIFAARMSDGQVHECRGRMPATDLPADYLDRGWGVLAGDKWRPPATDGAAGDVELEALQDGAALGVPEHWRETRLRGFRGQKGLKGDKGDKGDAGPGLIGMDLVRGEAGLAIVPRYADPAVQPDPIAITLLTDDPVPGRQAIAAFAGEWNAGRTYRRGDAVRASVAGRDRLVLSIRADNNARPDDPGAWQVMV